MRRETFVLQHHQQVVGVGANLCANKFAPTPKSLELGEQLPRNYAFPKKILLVLWLCGALFLTGACQLTPPPPFNAIEQNIIQQIQQGQPSQPSGQNPVPVEILKALMPPLPTGRGVWSNYPEEARFDLVVTQLPVRDVMLNITRATAYSVVVPPALKGYISLDIKNVTVPEAFEIIRQSYGYEYQREGNRFVVFDKSLQTQIFSVNYLNFNRRGNSKTQVSPSGLLNTVSDSKNTGKSANQNNSFASEVETQTNSDFWKELKEALSAIVGDKEGRQVVVNPAAGLVVIKAYPQELRTVADFLNRTQLAVGRQVLLEAKIMEVELNHGFQTGINWASLHQKNNQSLLASQTGGGSALSGSGLSEMVGQSGNLRPDAAFQGVNSSIAQAFGGIFALGLKTQQFAAFIELLQTQGKVHVLSSPRVATINNQKAIIKVGGDEFFVTGITNNNTVQGNTTVSSPTIELAPFFSGIALDVTPQIDEHNQIILHIHPTVSNVLQRDKSFVVGGANFSLPLAMSTIQESDNVVKAKNGEIIVIGGLMKEASTDDNASVPLLGDIPIIGNIFKHKKLKRIKKELVILLKPTVTDSGEKNGLVFSPPMYPTSHER